MGMGRTRIFCIAEEDLKKAHGAMERLHEKLEQVSSYGADDRRTSEEQIAELQLKVAELEEKAAESEDLRGIIATMEKKLASSDNTLKSYKKLYMDEKARSQQSQHHLARSHTYSPDRGVSQKENVLPMLSQRIKQEVVQQSLLSSISCSVFVLVVIGNHKKCKYSEKYMS